MNAKSVQFESLSTITAMVVCGIICMGCGTKIRALPKLRSSSVLAVHENRVDTDSFGGVDSVQVHQIPSGNIRVIKVSISGNTQRTETSSASFKVNGGIYVQ